MERKIFRGNPYDSRMGKPCAMWTEGYHYKIVEPDGRTFWYQTRNYDHLTVAHIQEPKNFSYPKEITWDDLNVKIRLEHFQTLFPEGSEEEEILFVYGEEEGSKIIELNKWADAHLIENRYVTKLIVNHIGRFQKWVYQNSHRRKWATCQTYYTTYLVDDKWLVTVERTSSYSRYEPDRYEIRVEDYAPIKEQKKAWGRRLSTIARKAGVPWEIAKMVSHLDDDEAIKILCYIKSIRESNISEKLQWELSCGKNRRCNALEVLLGKEYFNKIHCSSQYHSELLASYILK